MMNDLKIKTIEEFQREGISPEILFWSWMCWKF